MEDQQLQEIKEDIGKINERLDSLEREIRLVYDSDHTELQPPMLEVDGDFFSVMNTLRALYLDDQSDAKEIRRITKDIEEGNIKVDMTDLFFRFFIRQEIQNARIKLLLLSQKFELKGDLFDHLEDLNALINDHRYSVHQVVIGWKRFEREVSAELKRLTGNKGSR